MLIRIRLLAAELPVSRLIDDFDSQWREQAKPLIKNATALLGNAEHRCSSSSNGILSKFSPFLWGERGSYRKPDFAGSSRDHFPIDRNRATSSS
jgi:hypothetical protein